MRFKKIREEKHVKIVISLLIFYNFFIFTNVALYDDDYESHTSHELFSSRELVSMLLRIAAAVTAVISAETSMVDW